MQFLYSREIKWHLFCKLLLQLTVLSMPKGCNSPVSTFEPALFWMITFFCGQTLYIFLQITFCSFYKSSLLSDKKKDWSYCKYSNCYLKFQSGTNQLSILQEIFYFILIFKVFWYLGSWEAFVQLWFIFDHFICSCQKNVWMPIKL